MQPLYYKPGDGWAADFIPFYWQGTYHLFYLHDYRDAGRHGEGVPWRRISTQDFVHFTEHGEMLPRGGMDEQDLYVFTGSVIHAQGRFHIYYTGHNPHLRAQGRPEQAVMHAVSDDMDHWTKCRGELFFAPSELGYEPHDWRDPFVFQDEEGLYHMLLAARRTTGARTRRGVTAHCTSRDLVDWQVCEPLWQPDSYFAHECPDLFRMGAWYYLIYSEFTDQCRTRYVMSRSPWGPWRAPQDDVFDTRAYYAAKSAGDGAHRYLFGWNPTREGDRDDGRFQWGGSLVVHELKQLPDGRLTTAEPQTIKDRWNQPEPARFESWLGQARPQPAGVALSRADGMAAAVLTDEMPERYRLSCTCRFEEGTHAFGLQLGLDPEEDTSYGLIFYPGQGRLAMEALPNHIWGNMEDRGLNRTVRLLPGQTFALALSVDGSVVEAYVDDQVAFSARMCAPGKRLGVFAQHGGAVFSEVEVYR